jgi:hypothetical protein
MRLVPKNWATFQHYHKRRPPWVKLHRQLLDDVEFIRLPLASRALAPLIWLLASESDDGSFEGDPTLLAFRLRLPEPEVQVGLTGLITSEFVLDASTGLAVCKRVTPLEREERESREERDSSSNGSPKPPRQSRGSASEGFDRFWDAYGKKVGKKASKSQWTRHGCAEIADTVVAAAKRLAASTEPKFRKDPERWLRDRRWEDEPVKGKASNLNPRDLSDQEYADDIELL